MDGTRWSYTILSTGPVADKNVLSPSPNPHQNSILLQAPDLLTSGSRKTNTSFDDRPPFLGIVFTIFLHFWIRLGRPRLVYPLSGIHSIDMNKQHKNCICYFSHFWNTFKLSNLKKWPKWRNRFWLWPIWRSLDSWIIESTEMKRVDRLDRPK